MKPLVLAILLALPLAASAQDAEVAGLAQRIAALEADPQAASLAAYERLQARQAIDALAQARSRDRSQARYVADRRVQIAEIAARTASMQREIDRLDRERADLLVEASRQDAARARAEAERLRVQAQIQAEEAERLRQQAAAEAVAKQEVTALLEGVTDTQTAKLQAARDKQAALAREEAELVAGTKLPPSRSEGDQEVFTLAGDAFASGQATLTKPAAAHVRAVAAYLEAMPASSVRIEGHTDSQGAADANRRLSQRRADAVRDVLVAAGVPARQIEAVGQGAAAPVADNATAAGRGRNRRVEISVSFK
ncbi:OmpA family protein [Cognatilysobacter bugurensis]|uniref:Membrane protein n=1 Tax=Cognatilysobacter bugurensis TaxID=543356 RepID=A0A918T2U1_9GAMM|nr:OmpA family protein [Lysobacter bugurensis]GHA85741.1 membrane protein [Lysobacter bugurensis]